MRFSFLLLLSVFFIDVECKTKARNRKPNIVIFMTDDQDVMLGTMNVMTKTKEELINPGATFKNAFTTSPICCPSRSSFLTGLYAHSHSVLTNTLLCGSELWKKTHENRTFAKYLSEAGYSTGYFGKYLNEYKGDYVPPGWDMWQGLVKNSRYYNYTLIRNGKRETHRNDYSKDYLTDLVVNRSMEYFREAKQSDRHRPVMTMMSFPAPHGPEAGAPQYQNMFENVTSHITPSYNYGPNPDKHWIINHIKTEMDSTQHHFSQLLQQKRLQTLMSVDDAVEKFIQMLRDIGELDNTYVLYTSDHGFHIGQFRLAKGKSMPYDFDIRIPFFLRGPDIPQNHTLKEIVLNVDVAPTLLAIAGIPTPDHMEGRNFLPLLTNRDSISPPWRDRFLVERGKIPKKCKPTEPSKSTRIRQICLTKRDEFGYPCKFNQSTFCSHNNVTGEFRIKKCRPLSEKKRRQKAKCQCSDQLTNNSTLKLNKRDRMQGKELCRRKLFNFQTLANEYALSEVGVYINRRTALKNLTRRRQRTVGEKRVLRRYASRKKKNRNRRGTRSQKMKQLQTAPWKIQRYRQLFSTDHCKKLKKDNKRLCQESVRLARTYNQKLRREVSKDINNALNRITRRLFKDIFQQCLELYKRSLENTCECSEESVMVNEGSTIDLSKDKVKSLSSPTPEEHTEGDNPVPRKIKKRKRPKGASRNCASANSNSTVTGMTCFRLDEHKWVTPPIWKGEERCYCTNSNNNTYWCMRVLNEKEDMLYCVFVTNFIEFFDMKLDPHQLINTYSEQSLEKISILHNDLKYLSKCNGSSGDKSCYIPRGGLNTLSSTNENESSFCDLNTNSYFTSEIDTSFDNTVNVDNNDEDWNEPPEGDLFDMVIDSATPAIGDRWRGYFQTAHNESRNNTSPKVKKREGTSYPSTE